MSVPPLPGEPPRHDQLETIDRSLGLVSKRGERGGSTGGEEKITGSACLDE